MARALVLDVRDDRGQWVPRAVILAVPGGIRVRVLPGVGLERWRDAVLRDARPPRVQHDLTGRPIRGDYLDWAGWAIDALSNGHDHSIHEVEPAPTLEMLYRREVLGLSPAAQREHGGRPPVATRNVPRVSGFRGTAGGSVTAGTDR